MTFNIVSLFTIFLLIFIERFFGIKFTENSWIDAMIWGLLGGLTIVGISELIRLLKK